MAPPRIITTHVYPPIPIRTMDWQAHYDGEEDEQMNVGRGRTELDAVVDLIDKYNWKVICPECEAFGRVGDTLPTEKTTEA